MEKIKVKDSKDTKVILGEQEIYNVQNLSSKKIELKIGQNSPFRINLEAKTFEISQAFLSKNPEIKNRLKNEFPDINFDKANSHIDITSISIDASGNLKISMPVNDPKIKKEIVINPISISVLDKSSKKDNIIFSTTEISKNFLPINIGFPEVFSKIIIAPNNFKDYLNIEFKSLPAELFGIIKEKNKDFTLELKNNKAKLLKLNNNIFIQKNNMFVMLDKNSKNVLFLEKTDGTFDAVFVEKRDKEGRVSKGLRIANILDEDRKSLADFGANVEFVSKDTASSQLYAVNDLKTRENSSKVNYFDSRAAQKTPPSPAIVQGAQAVQSAQPTQPAQQTQPTPPSNQDDDNDNGASSSADPTPAPEAQESVEPEPEENNELEESTSAEEPHVEAEGAPAETPANSTPPADKKDDKKKKEETAKAVKDLLTNLGKIIGLLLFIVGIGVGPIAGMTMAIIGFSLYSTGFAGDVIYDMVSSIGKIIKNRRKRKKANSEQEANTETAPTAELLRLPGRTLEDEHALALPASTVPTSGTTSPTPPAPGTTPPSPTPSTTTPTPYSQVDLNKLSLSEKDIYVENQKLINLYEAYNDFLSKKDNSPEKDKLLEDIKNFNYEALWEMKDSGVITEYLESYITDPELKKRFEKRKQELRHLREAVVTQLNNDKIEDEVKLKISENEAKVKKEKASLTLEKAIDKAKQKEEKAKKKREERERIEAELIKQAEEQQQKDFQAFLAQLEAQKKAQEQPKKEIKKQEPVKKYETKESLADKLKARQKAKNKEKEK